jgi:hypothetical protein
MLLICSHGRVAAPHSGAAAAAVYLRKLHFFALLQIVLELRVFFPVGISESSHLFIYVH